MLSLIYELKEGNPNMRKIAAYSISPKKALICYIMQYIYNDFNTWEYPEELDGIRASDTVKDHWYYDDIPGRRVIAAYPV